MSAEPLWRFWQRARFRLGCAILGNDWWGVITRQTIIAQRARKAVGRDGCVTLAHCEPLAVALYAEMPGNWELTATQTQPLPASGSPDT